MRSLMAGVTVAALAVLLAACGTTKSPHLAPTTSPTATASPTPSATASPTATPTPTPSATLARCTTSELTAALANGQGAAGSVFYSLEFKNVSASSCTLFGNPGVSMVAGSSGTQVGASATFVNRASATTVTLAPGAQASAVLQIVEAGNFPESSCGIETVAGLRVYPPGSTAALFIPDHKLQGCRDSSAKLLQVGPVQS